MVAVYRDNVGHGIELVASHQSQGIDLSSEAIVRVAQPRWVLLQGKGRTPRAYAINTTIASSVDWCEVSNWCTDQGSHNVIRRRAEAGVSCVHRRPPFR